jgi:hypothetical protein
MVRRQPQMIGPGLLAALVGSQHIRIHAQPRGWPRHRRPRRRFYIIEYEPQPRQRAQLNGRSETIRRATATSRVHERRIRRCQGEGPDRLVPPDVRERLQALHLVMGETAVSPPTYLTIPTVAQTVRTVARPPTAPNCASVQVRDVRWLFGAYCREPT